MRGLFFGAGERSQAAKPVVLLQVLEERIELGGRLMASHLGPPGQGWLNILDLQRTVVVARVGTGAQIPNASSRRRRQDQQEQDSVHDAEAAQGCHRDLPMVLPSQSGISVMIPQTGDIGERARTKQAHGWPPVGLPECTWRGSRQP